MIKTRVLLLETRFITTPELSRQAMRRQHNPAHAFTQAYQVYETSSTKAGLSVFILEGPTTVTELD